MRKRSAAKAAAISDGGAANPEENLVHCTDESTIEMIVNIIKTQHCIEQEWRLPANTLRAYREHVMQHGTEAQQKAIEKR